MMKKQESIMKRQGSVIACVALLLVAASCARRIESLRAQSDAARAAQTFDAAPPVRVSAEGKDAAEPAVAVGRDGTAYVAWVEHQPSGGADVWLAHFDAASEPVSPPVRVNPNAGEATAWQGDPPTVAVAPDGVVYVGWTARAAGGAHASNLQLSASRDGGQSIGAPVRVNDDARPGVHGLHSLAVAQDGRIYVAWLDERNVAPATAEHAGSAHHHAEWNREVFFASSADGGRTFSPNQRVAQDACPCCKTSLAAGADGRIYVGWRQVLPGDYRHIAVASTADGGHTFTPAVIVSDDRWQIAGCPVSGPALGFEADGTLRVLWYSAGAAGAVGLYWSESHDGGRTFAPRRALAESSGRGSPMLLNDSGGGLVAVWEAKDEGGTPRVTTERLTEAGDQKTSALVTKAGELPAAAGANGQLFVAYLSKRDAHRHLWLVRAAPRRTQREQSTRDISNSL